MTAGAALALVLATLLMVFADERVMRAIMASHSPIIAGMREITDVGKSNWYLFPSLILFLITAFLDWSAWKYRAKAWALRLFGQSAYLFGSVAVSGIMVNILKIPIGRARPKMIDSLGPVHFEPFAGGYDFASMPSGHSTTMGAVAMVLMIWFPKLRWLVLPLFLVFAATRMAAQAHYPSDTVIGFALGLLYALFLARWLGRRGVVFRIAPGRLLPKIR